MATKHVVTEGDCCSSLAAKNGFADYHAIYDDAANAALRGKRKNPNTLVVGDEVQVPDKSEKNVKKPGGAEHKFVAKVSKVKLRLQIRNSEGKPCEGKSFSLHVGSRPAQAGHSMPGGFIEMEVDAQAKSGWLVMVLSQPPGPAPALVPVPLSDPPPYPPVLDPATFRDALDTAYLGGDADVHNVQWQLQIGSLPSHNEVVGAQVRLRNLGYTCGGKDGDADDPETKAAAKAFQKSQKLIETGLIKDVQDALRNQHDRSS